jgi:hypothetical protein
MSMEIAKTGKEKQLTYTTEYRQFNKAMKEEFYLEAVAIGYAIIEDRLTAFLHHAGLVTRTNEDLRINRKVYPYIRKLLKKEDDYSIKIKDISVKITLVTALLNMTENEANAIDAYVTNYVQGLKRKRAIAQTGYMHDLYTEIKKVNAELVLSTFVRIEPWRIQRNHLIHALLNKTVESTKDVKKECAEESYAITRAIDNNLVKPFKQDNKLRKKYNIQ